MKSRPAFALFSPLSIGALVALTLCSCRQEAPAQQAGAKSETKPAAEKPVSAESSKSESPDAKKSDPKAAPALATFGGGCFWCTEAVMERLEGVVDVKSGYMGGHVENPTYEQVCEKTTGHVEVIQVTFDPAKIKYEELLDVFWQAHDPTTWDQQGADKGPQYRSAIFTHSAEQKAQAENSKRALGQSGKFKDPIVTEIRDAAKFWVAEGYHQDFYKNNPNYGYCRAVISPKLKKLGFE